MNALDCERVRDSLPEWTRGRLADRDAAGVRAHLASCAGCAAEAAVVRTVARHRVETPADLTRRIHWTARRRRVAALRRRLLAAAAVVALAWLGRRAFLPRASEAPIANAADGVDPGNLIQPFSGWIEADGILAGALMVDALSDEELELMLAEVES